MRFSEGNAYAPVFRAISVSAAISAVAGLGASDTELAGCVQPGAGVEAELSERQGSRDRQPGSGPLPGGVTGETEVTI